MTIPKYFRNIGEKNLVSYDYMDIATGTGIQSFYLHSSETSAGTTYHLTGTVAYSDDILRQLDGNGTTDDDFDLTAFNLPKTVKGTAHLIVPWYAAYGGSAGSGSMSMVCKIRHWDGTTETDLATVTSETIIIAALGAAKGGVWNFPMTIAQKHFKKGDILRVSVAMTISGTETDKPKLYFGIDPKNRTNASMDSTQSVLLMPFKLDL